MTEKTQLQLLERRHVDVILSHALGYEYDWATHLRVWTRRAPERRHAGIKGDPDLCLHPCAYTRGRTKGHTGSKTPLYRKEDIGEFVRKVRNRLPHLKPGIPSIKWYEVDADLLSSPIYPAEWIEATPV